MNYKLTLFAFALCVTYITHGQVSINGPSCVLAGMEYEYLISTPDTTGNGIQICLNGGTYQGIQKACLNDSLVSSVFVVWNRGIPDASISFSSHSGNAAASITVTTQLQPGAIDSSFNFLTVGYDSSAPNLTCSSPSGGNCSPSYNYQWQQSADNLNWIDIGNATDQNLNVSAILSQTTYFRRKVTETNSGSIAYSNTVILYVARNGNSETGEFQDKSIVSEINGRKKTTL